MCEPFDTPSDETDVSVCPAPICPDRPSGTRSRAWRRAQAKRARAAKSSPPCRDPSHALLHPKKWSHIYFRKNKLHRARKIGKIWPPKEWKKLMADTQNLKILFICSQNQWRSPTAEKVFATYEGLETRSAGTARNARHQINMDDLRWADIIFCMEEKHKSRILADFRQAASHKTITVLGIEDNYQFMDEELIEILESSVPDLLEKHAI